MEAARYGDRRKVNGITWDAQPDEDKPKPTPRILGRFSRTKRVPRPPSSISDTNDADSEHDNGRIVGNYSRSQSRSVQRIPRMLRQSDSEFEFQPESDAETLRGPAPALQGFFASKSPATQRIVLASIFHSWLQMAETTRLRRDELLRKWTEAMSFRNRQVLGRALRIWRNAADDAALSSGSSYERVQLKLATMHCRNLYLRRAFGHLRDCWDLQQRLHSWEKEAPQRIIVVCWLKWRDRLAQKKSAAIRLAADYVKQATQASALRRTLRSWRQQATLRQQEQTFTQWQRKRMLRESVHVWRLQTVERDYTQRQKKQSPVKQTLVRWRDAAGLQRRERDCEMMNELVLRKQLLDWHAVSQQAKGMDDQADTLRKRSLLYSALDGLFDGVQARQTADAQALRYRQYRTMDRTFGVWRQQFRARRDSQLQSRAIRDLARRRDQKQRRLVLSAWREVTVRVNRGENYADELVSRRRRAMLVTCFRRWYASCSFDGIAQNTGTIPRFAIAPPQSQPQEPQMAPRPLSIPQSAPVADAQTMTSMIEDFPRRGRAVSVQTEAAPSRTESDDRNELLRRVRVAEEEAKRYKSLCVDPKKAKMEFVEDEERLEGLLGQWQGDRRRRQLQSVFRKMRTRCTNSRRCQEQEQRLLAVVGRKHSDNRLRQMLRQWRGVARSQANAEVVADRHYSQLGRRVNSELCCDVLFEWREQLKERRQLMMSADKRRQVHVADKFLSTLLGRFAKQRELELEADDKRREMVLSRTWIHLYVTFARNRTKRVQSSMHASDGEALPSTASVRPANSPAMTVLAPEPNGLDNTALIEAQELENYFSAWRMLVEDVREIQGAVMERLPTLLQQRAVRSLASAEGFDWGLAHQGRVLATAIKQWRRQLPAAQDRGIAEGDGPNSVELQRYEKMVMRAREFRLKKTAFHRWMVANRGKLAEKRRTGQYLERLVSVIASRIRRVKVAREKEREFKLRPAVTLWRNQYFINASRMDNAQVQANASLARLCILHWVSQIRAHREHDNGRALYMRAIAFRWEKQARRALDQWMRASSSDKIKVRLAQRAGRQREIQLQRVADQWCRNRMRKRALATLCTTARCHALQREMSSRFATAWGNANVQRHALNIWRQRMSPSSSMYFSVVGSA